MEPTLEYKGKYLMATQLRRTLETYQRQTKASWNLIEQDYLLSWVLKGIASIPELYNHLVFKGGTCLRKCYFGDYRFSQDGDFSVQGEYPKGAYLEELLNKACEKVSEIQEEHNIYIRFSCLRYEEKRPHPGNQEAFTIAAQYPWHREPLTRVMIEVTSSERVILPPVVKTIIHPYESFFEARMQVYALEEIIAEKIRALLQFSKKLHERGWGRSRARDYYDLWRIITNYKTHLNYDIIPDVVREKCANKEIDFISIDELFSPILMRDLESSWSIWVKPLVVLDLPNVGIVIDNLKHELQDIFK